MMTSGIMRSSSLQMITVAAAPHHNRPLRGELHYIDPETREKYSIPQQGEVQVPLTSFIKELIRNGSLTSPDWDGYTGDDVESTSPGGGGTVSIRRVVNYAPHGASYMAPLGTANYVGYNLDEAGYYHVFIGIVRRDGDESITARFYDESGDIDVTMSVTPFMYANVIYIDSPRIVYVSMTNLENVENYAGVAYCFTKLNIPEGVKLEPLGYPPSVQ